jgi:hypothetical protein
VQQCIVRGTVIDVLIDEHRQVDNLGAQFEQQMLQAFGS